MVEKTQENTTFVVTTKERACSFEFGKAGNRFKVYFDTPEELRALLKGLEDWTGEDLK